MALAHPGHGSGQVPFDDRAGIPARWTARCRQTAYPAGADRRRRRPV